MQWLLFENEPTMDEIRSVERNFSDEMVAAVTWLLKSPWDPDHVDCTFVRQGGCDVIGYNEVEVEWVYGSTLEDDWFPAVIVVEDDGSVTYLCAQCWGDRFPNL